MAHRKALKKHINSKSSPGSGQARMSSSEASDDGSSWDDYPCCFYCGENDPGKIKACEYCQDVYCCTADHFNIHCYSFDETQGQDSVMKAMNAGQQSHLKDAKHICFPFMVDYEDSRGRFLIATRDIKAGEAVLIDHPFVQGPPAKAVASCVQCSKFATPDSGRCSNCGLPACNETCQNGKYHQLECQVFADAFTEHFKAIEAEDEDKKNVILSPEISSYDSPVPLLSLITPLRLLLRYRRDMINQIEADKDNKESSWFRVMQLMDHEEDRKKDQKSWMMNHILVVAYIQKVLAEAAKHSKDPRPPAFNAKQIHKVIGLLRTNGVKLEGEKAKSASKVGLYPIYSLTNHNCYDCNTRTFKVKTKDDEFVLGLRATMDIRKGDQIFTRYTTPQLGSLRRQQLLQNQWHFSCDCQRCRDPTECGSFLNAILCPDCQSVMLPKDPRDLRSVWICQDQQEHIQKAEVAIKLVMSLEEAVEQADGSMVALEDILEKNSGKTVHENHFIMGSAREKLVQLLLHRRQKLEYLLKEKELSEDQESKIKDEIANCFERQLALFQKIAKVMMLVDLPKKFWEHSLQKMISEFESVKK